MAPHDPFDSGFGSGVPPHQWTGVGFGANSSGTSFGSGGGGSAEMGVAWNAKEIDGKLYLPIEQVHELLQKNNVLPKMQEALARRFKKES